MEIRHPPAANFCDRNSPEAKVAKQLVRLRVARMAVVNCAYGREKENQEKTDEIDEESRRQESDASEETS